MKVRYKNTKIETASYRFNTSALNEVFTGDDSVFITDLEVFLEKRGEWKDLSQAFRDKDVIVDNYNIYFFEPLTDLDRDRGYTL